MGPPLPTKISNLVVRSGGRRQSAAALARWMIPTMLARPPLGPVNSYVPIAMMTVPATPLKPTLPWRALRVVGRIQALHIGARRSMGMPRSHDARYARSRYA
jgi:hypothetical protein